MEEINAYVLDPAHLQPSRNDSTSNGHFATMNPNGMSGTPRGFSLASIPMQGSGFISSFNGMPPGSSGMGMDGAGPMRRGGRYPSQRSAPYDRRGGPRRGGRTGPPQGGFLDAAGPSSTAVPREATAGRSLKSYEDLDAVGGPQGAASSGGAGGGSGDAQLDY